MLQVYLMDRHGSPRLVGRQPAPVCDPIAIKVWMAVYCAMANASEGSQLRVSFRTDGGKNATAFIIPGNSLIDIGRDGNDVKLYMYARDIVLDETGRI